MSILVLGAGGVLGRLVLRHLAGDHAPLVAAGRDLDRLAAVAADVGVQQTRAVTGEALPETFDGASVVVVCVPHTALRREAVVAAAATVGAQVVDLCPAPAAWMGATRALASGTTTLPGSALPGSALPGSAPPDPAPDTITVVPGAGLRGAVGECLARLAAGAVTDPRAVHIAHTLLDRVGMWWGIPSPGARAELAEALSRPFPAQDHGTWVEESPAQARRLAWFPRPVGPAHAVAVPSCEPLAVVQGLPSLEEARCYEAMPSWRAEALQMLAGMTRWEAAGRRIAARITRPRPEAGPARRHAMRWAAVAEGAGAEGVARAWANGRDPLDVTAATAALLARRLCEGGAPAGVVGAAEVVDAATLLDGLAVTCDLRWSVVRPPDLPARG